eukprot:GFKZ01013268.1.p2 GENE.GFKZ01013268.1~~GFKZ01013268.1.p2  ORF type:complete len:118 (-),score=2.47 GFKZ01013268.1:271-624(-)
MNPPEYTPIASNPTASTRPWRTIVITVVTAIATTLLVLAISYQTTFGKVQGDLYRSTPARPPVAAPASRLPWNTCACPFTEEPVCCYFAGFKRIVASDCDCDCVKGENLGDFRTCFS